jgi:TPR repeat protein
MRPHFLIILLIAIGFYQTSAQAADNGGLSDSELKSLERAALQGDGLAAFKLSNHAGYGAHSKEAKNAELRWATISAEDGLPAGSYQLGMILYGDESDPANIVRAEFWLKRAKAQGIAMADFGLCLIERKKDSTLPDCKLPSGVIQNGPPHVH